MDTPDVAEMTRFLAVEVMGWTRVVIRRCKVHYCLPIKGTGWKVFSPDTVPADRDMLVEEMRKKGFYIRADALADGGDGIFKPKNKYRCQIGRYVEYADTPGRAVLMAAYQAVKGMKEQHHDT